MQEIFQFLMEQWILSGTILLLIVFLMYSEKPKKYKIVDNNEAIDIINSSNTIIIDVRDKKEINSGKINLSTNIPLTDIKNKITKLDKNKTIFTYCKNGIRSKTAANLFVKNEFKEIYTLKGGFDAWKDAGLPIEK